MGEAVGGDIQVVVEGDILVVGGSHFEEGNLVVGVDNPHKKALGESPDKRK